MAVQAKKLFEGLLLPNAVAVQYTGPTVGQLSTLVKAMTVTNNDSTNPHSVTVHICGPGVSPSNATLVVDAQPLLPLQSLDLLVNKLIAPGGTLQAFADDNSHVSAQASGVWLA